MPNTISRLDTPCLEALHLPYCLMRLFQVALHCPNCMVKTQVTCMIMYFTFAFFRQSEMIIAMQDILLQVPRATGKLFSGTSVVLT